MKFIATAGALLMAEAVLATPISTLMANAKVELQRRNDIRRGNRMLGGKVRPVTDGEATTVESTNWAGAALSTSGVTEVTGTFTVPKPSAPSGGSGEYCGAAWVGIDGYANADLIQTGVLWCVEGSSYEYEPWYEYLPASLIEYTGITISAGESVTVTATKTGTNSGVTTLTAGGKSVTHTFSGQSSPIPGASAEWIVEDFTEGDSLVAFANFGTVTFTGATAIINGVTTTAAGANNIILITESGSDETSTTISGSTVTVKYV